MFEALRSGPLSVSYTHLNLERLIFHLLGNDAEKTAELMNALNTQGQYELTDFDTEILDLFAAEYATEAETAAEIKRVYEADSYICLLYTSFNSITLIVKIKMSIK